MKFLEKAKRPSSGEHGLYQHHVEDGAGRHGQEHLPPPDMEDDGHGEGQGLRNAVGPRRQGDVLEAVDHEQGEDGRRQHFAQVLHIRRRLSARREQEERDVARRHGAKDTHGDGDQLLCKRHFHQN